MIACILITKDTHLVINSYNTGISQVITERIYFLFLLATLLPVVEHPQYQLPATSSLLPFNTPVMLAITPVKVIPFLLNTTIRGKTHPAEFIPALTTGHMVAAINFRYPDATSFIRTSLRARFEMFLGGLLRLIGVLFVLELCAGVAFVPFYAVDKTHLVPAFPASDDRRVFTAPVELAGTAAFFETPAEIRDLGEGLE